MMARGDQRLTTGRMADGIRPQSRPDRRLLAHLREESTYRWLGSGRRRTPTVPIAEGPALDVSGSGNLAHHDVVAVRITEGELACPRCRIHTRLFFERVC